MRKHFQLVLLAALFAGSCSTALAAFTRDGATIMNSGSTNTAPYSLKVWSDGRAAMISAARVSTPFRVPGAETADFFRDVALARANPGSPGHCMKSASFGTSTTVLWHGWTSFDLSCPPHGAQFALAADVRAIVGAAGVFNNPPRRIPLMPGELHRMPPSPNASPTPAPKEQWAQPLSQGE